MVGWLWEHDFVFVGVADVLHCVFFGVAFFSSSGVHWNIKRCLFGSQQIRVRQRFDVLEGCDYVTVSCDDE